MISEIAPITHSTPIGAIFDKSYSCGIFDGDMILQKVLEFFSTHTPDAVIVTQKSLAVGILTQKDMLRALYSLDNTGLPIREFMSSPLQLFDTSTTIIDILDEIEDNGFNKIVVHEDNKIIGIIDKRDLHSICYAQLNPLVKHEYNMVHSLMGLVGEGERGLLKMATTDALTGIGNRRLFEEIFQAHQSLGDRYDVTLFLLLFDIDNFKSINDTFGHNVGDSVLKELASLVGKSIRKSDIFIRWGGEEFAILLRYSEPMTVMKIAEQIRKKIDKNSFETIVHVTCSFGLTSIAPHDTLEDVFIRADKALYRAKEDGKNVVRMELT
ncbi:MAG: GGDEF domain-containing protein [Sulfuricurvum sp.]|uniref:GGDEF domain-containing protein n=1 Tax=Sulfuricurvum sp. TaxID=2025608 RepID=UPI00261F51A8|nr:GGDEF domain-containing protein [Sulfuricurvum sp.]MDD2829884.1 GGDEF domain-containing protein [Sulfuricurvum sp.]MDD4949546.1 GGDEF domain-containing protein [Sulfuricurvum sp.]